MKYICNACGYIYDEEKGDPDSGLPPGTRFADIPDDWSCPLCALTKADFVPYTAPPQRCAPSAAKPSAGGATRRAGVLIVGGGRAGWQMAQALRALDAERPITLLSACAADVYDKPLLSVALARGMATQSLVRESGADSAARLGVRLLAHTQALRISTRTHTLHSTRGAHVYEHLVLAHGAQAVLPPHLSADLCWRVNHLEAYARLRQALDARAAQEVVIIGAGMIGCELANDLALGGHRVRLLDVQDRPLARWPASEAAERLTRAWQGLPIEFSGSVHVSAVQRQGEQSSVLAEDGRQWLADQVIVAIGLQTSNRLAQSAGLEWNNGVAVQPDSLRTNVPNIFALGDCIAIGGRPSRFIEPIGRQARTIAAHICGCTPVGYEQVATPVRVKTSSLPLSLAA